jgi:hypothetical protein
MRGGSEGWRQIKGGEGVSLPPLRQRPVAPSSRPELSIQQNKVERKREGVEWGGGRGGLHNRTMLSRLAPKHASSS